MSNYRKDSIDSEITCKDFLKTKVNKNEIIKALK